MAGTGTIGDSLEFAVLYMLKFPEIQRKVHAEIDSVIPSDRVPTLNDRERWERKYTKLKRRWVRSITNAI